MTKAVTAAPFDTTPSVNRTSKNRGLATTTRQPQTSQQQSYHHQQPLLLSRKPAATTELLTTVPNDSNTPYRNNDTSSPQYDDYNNERNQTTNAVVTAATIPAGDNNDVGSTNIDTTTTNNNTTNNPYQPKRGGAVVTPSSGNIGTDATLYQRMNVDKEIVDELLLVCGVIGTTTSSTEELVPVTDCLNWLQDLQRALRRDDDTTRSISLLLGQWNIVQHKLLPLVLHCKYDTAIVMTVCKILVILTKPLADATVRAGQMIIDTSSGKFPERYECCVCV